MDKEQLIQAIIHNAKATLSFAKDSNDPQLECIAHATLLAVTATQQGHDDELLSPSQTSNFGITVAAALRGAPYNKQ